MAFGLRFTQKSKPRADRRGQELVGVIEPGVEFEGRIKMSSGMLRLNGHFKGELQSGGVVVVAEQGEVEGEIHSTITSVAGKVKGAVHASEAVEIKARGVIVGDIYTPSLVVEPGGYLDGQCHMPTPTAGSPSAAPASHSTQSSSRR